MLNCYIVNEALPRAYGEALGTAKLREACSDFIVREQLSFMPSGEGPHQLLYVQKTNATTDQAVRWLAKCYGQNKRDIGYAGLKDRRAITSQWFSVPISQTVNDEATTNPAAELSESGQDEAFKILWQHANQRKLRRGALSSNLFRIRLTQLQAELEQLEQRLQQLAVLGFPNYFGSQRFGFGGNNVRRACQWLASGQGKRLRRIKPIERSLFISSLRSAAFNAQLAERVRMGTWQQLQSGDYASLSGSNSFFAVTEAPDAELQARAVAGELSPSGCLPGRADQQSPISETEQAFLAADAETWQRLSELGVSAGRRAFRVIPKNLQWRFDHAADKPSLELSFRLPAGAYATVLIRELLDADE